MIGAVRAAGGATQPNPRGQGGEERAPDRGERRLGWRPPGDRSFFSRGERAQAVMLQKREDQHREQGMMMQAQPTASFEVIEAEFFLRLLVRLLADPTGLDGRGERAQRRVRGVVRQVGLAFPVCPPFTHQPRKVAGQVLAVGRWRAIGDPNAHRRELSVQRTARPRPPVHRVPPCGGEHRLGAAADLRRDLVSTRPATGRMRARGPQPHVCRRDFSVW